ncbi:MAG: hypothetical protein ACT4PL_00555 [Phycisphaerales bacterium]
MRTPLASSFVLMTLAGAAHAQTALGDGRALDANLSTTGGRLNAQVRDINAMVQQNNRVVTGQAGSGRSFRGSLGYQATNEFRGSIASDTSYTFRRDSASGQSAGGGLRSTDALRYQFSLVEGRPGADPFGVGSSASSPGPAGEVRGGSIGTGAAIATFRSVSQYQARSTQLPVLLQYTTNPTDQSTFAITASPLRGIGVTPLGQSSAKTFGLTGLERPIYGVANVSEAIEQDRKRVRTAPGGIAAAKDPASPTDPLSTAIDQRLTPATPSYGRVITSLTQSIDQRFVATRPGADTAKPTDTAPLTPEQPGWLKELDALRERLRGDAKKAADAAVSRPGPSDDPILDALTKMNPRLDELVNKQPIGPDVDDLYTERMRDGQNKLSAGRYFESEGSFTLALLARPGDPLALAGRTNAQLSAGLFLSASKGLRDLLAEHPEMIPVRFGPDLLPNSARAAELAAQLRAEGANTAGLLGADAGLLLAYLGFHMEQPSWTADGLAMLDSKTGPDESGAKALANLVRAVWSAAPSR